MQSKRRYCAAQYLHKLHKSIAANREYLEQRAPSFAAYARPRPWHLDCVAQLLVNEKLRSARSFDAPTC